MASRTQSGDTFDPSKAKIHRAERRHRFPEEDKNQYTVTARTRRGISTKGERTVTCEAGCVAIVYRYSILHNPDLTIRDGDPYPRYHPDYLALGREDGELPDRDALRADYHKDMDTGWF